MRKIRVAAVQFEHATGEKQKNLATIRKFVAEASQQGVEIIAFPECCISGYWALRHFSREQLRELAEPVFDGPSSQALKELALANEITVGAGLVEIDSDGTLYNTYVVAMPDGNAVRHRKLHCFISEHMASGSEYTVFDTPHGCRLGVLICYDNNIFENVRMTALMGAEILLAPHQTGGCKTTNPLVMGVVDRKLWDEREANPEAIEAEFMGPKGRGWMLRWLPCHAHDNGLFLLFANGVGPDDDEVRTGNAMIIDPHGQLVTETWKAGDDMVIADLDPALQECSGQTWIRARRPDLYGLLSQPTGKEVSPRQAKFGME